MVVVLGERIEYEIPAAYNYPGEIGIVPQTNSCLWKNQTVDYHLQFYATLGGLKKDTEEIHKLKTLLDLHKFSNT